MWLFEISTSLFEVRPGAFIRGNMVYIAWSWNWQLSIVLWFHNETDDYTEIFKKYKLEIKLVKINFDWFDTRAWT